MTHPGITAAAEALQAQGQQAAQERAARAETLAAQQAQRPSKAQQEGAHLRGHLEAAWPLKPEPMPVLGHILRHPPPNGGPIACFLPCFA